MKKIARKPINKDIKVTKSLLSSIVVALFKTIILLIKNVLYIAYVLFYNFNNLMSRLYMKLPRILRVGLIYTLIFCSFVNYITLDKKELKNRNIDFVAIATTIDNDEVAIVTDEDIEIEEVEEIEKEEKEETADNCNLGTIECKIYNKGIEKGMTKKQAILAVAISKHETGKWTSNAFKTKNNFGGIMKSGSLASYDSFDAGLERFINLLNDRYYAQGLNSIEKIQPVYAPIGAKNDPNDLNSNWIKGVTKYYNEYLNK